MVAHIAVPASPGGVLIVPHLDYQKEAANANPP